MDETRNAIGAILSGRGVPDAVDRAARACESMEAAFEDAMVKDFESLLPACGAIPDHKDTHVLAAALKTQAHVIVTDNTTHFPKDALDPFGIEVRSADAFIADTIALDVGRAVPAIQRMRVDLKNPTISADGLLLKLEAQGLIETVDVLKPYVHSW